MCGTVGNYFCNYAGGMRQDTINRKVYFICPSYLTDTLLYDFTVNVGDTIHTAWCTFGSPNAYTQNVIVSTIDSVLVGSNYHKRFNTNNFFAFIEGIGNNTGLLEPIELGQNDTWGLDCFTHNADIYPNTSTSCHLITGIDEQIGDNMFQIYPNPTTSTLIINKPANTNKNETLEITDITGKVLITIPLLDMQTSIAVKSYHKGMYFINISSDTGFNNYKFIKQ